MSRSDYYSCLYSKHKTQKRKVWNDGKLTVTSTGSVTLTPVSSNGSSIIGVSTSTGNSINASLDSVIVSLNEVQRIKNGCITDLEMDKFLVQIEGPYQGETGEESNNSTSNTLNNSGSTTSNTATNSSNTILNRRSINNVNAKSTRISKGMQKLMSRKFQVPQKIRTMRVQQQQQNQQNNIYKGRKRPLQPGEWERQCQMKTMTGNQNPYQNGYNHNGNNNSNNGTNGTAQDMIHHNKSNFDTNNNNSLHPYNRNQHNFNQPQGFQMNHRQHQQQHQHMNGSQNNSLPTNHCNKNQLNNNLNSMNGNATIATAGKHKNNQNNSGFTSNDFDPSSFYGDDEDDEENGDEAFDEESQDGKGSNRNDQMNQNSEYAARKNYNTHKQQPFHPENPYNKHNNHCRKNEPRNDDESCNIQQQPNNTSHATVSSVLPRGTADSRNNFHQEMTQTSNSHSCSNDVNSISGATNNSTSSDMIQNEALSGSDLLKLFSINASNSDHDNSSTNINNDRSQSKANNDGMHSSSESNQNPNDDKNINSQNHIIKHQHQHQHQQQINAQESEEEESISLNNEKRQQEIGKRQRPPSQPIVISTKHKNDRNNDCDIDKNNDNDNDESPMNANKKSSFLDGLLQSEAKLDNALFNPNGSGKDDFCSGKESDDEFCEWEEHNDNIWNDNNDSDIDSNDNMHKSEDENSDKVDSLIVDSNPNPHNVNQEDDEKENAQYSTNITPKKDSLNRETTINNIGDSCGETHNYGTEETNRIENQGNKSLMTPVMFDINFPSESESESDSEDSFGDNSEVV